MTALTAHWQLVRAYLLPWRGRIVVLFLLVLTSIAFQLASPQLLGAFIDAATSGKPLRTMTGASLGFLGTAMAAQGLSILTTYLSGDLAWATTNTLRRDLALHCLRLDMPFHQQHTPGALIERVDGDVSRLANALSLMAAQLLGHALLALGILVVMFVADWRLGLVAAGYTILASATLRAFRRPVSEAWRASRETEAELLGLFGETFTGREDIRANGARAYAMRLLHRASRRVTRRWLHAKVVQGASGGIGEGLYAMARVAILAISAVLYSRGHVTLGAAYIAFHYIGRLATPISRIRREIGDLQQASASVRRITEIRETAPRVTETRRAQLPPGPLPVGVERVAFHYDDATGLEERRAVLQDVAFTLQPARVLGLLGRTGSGKTTLTRLLFRLYDPTAGVVRVGGTDLRDLALADLRRRIGLVTQDVQLFRDTIRHNLTLFDPCYADDALEAALHDLGLWTWYSGLPDRLDTVLSAGSGGLSAGEAQLLALVRVFLRDPGLVLLDEASSRLDPITRGLLDAAVWRLLEGRTAIVIAHRLETVQRADEIMILDAGRVAEHGPRSALAGDPDSRYRALLRTGMEDALA